MLDREHHGIRRRHDHMQLRGNIVRYATFTAASACCQQLCLVRQLARAKVSKRVIPQIEGASPRRDK